MVQIVDARNPLRFRCEDLEAYVTDIEGMEGEHSSGQGIRKNLLLINKADLLTAKQRSVCRSSRCLSEIDVDQDPYGPITLIARGLNMHSFRRQMQWRSRSKEKN